MDTNEERQPRQPGGWQRFGWLVLIWCLSVAALGVAAGLMRLLMRAAGLAG